MYPTIELFGKTLGVYGIFAFVGGLLAIFLSYFLIRGKDYKIDDAFLLAIVVGGGCLVGGKILYGLTRINVLIEMFVKIDELNLKQIIQYLVYCFGGQVYYGGFIGSCIGLLLYFRCSLARTLNKRKVLDVFAIVVPLFHSIGRVGCFFGGCCYGIESCFGFIVENNIYNPDINGVRRFPTPLLEALCNLILFIILLVLFLKKKKQGKLLYLYMVIYPIIRFLDEFLRGDELRGFLGALSTSQWISIAILCIGTMLLILERKNTYSFELHVPEESKINNI